MPVRGVRRVENQDPQGRGQVAREKRQEVRNEPNYKADYDRFVRALRIIGGALVLAFFGLLLVAGVAGLAAQ